MWPIPAAEVSLFVSSIYIAALVLQYPIGWMSDRMDRRVLIIWVSFLGAAGSLIAFLLPGSFTAIIISGAIVGGTSNPLYALLLAYTNDYLDNEDMASASGRLVCHEADGLTDVTQTYDAHGNRLSRTDVTGTETYTYDSLNRLSTITYPDAKFVVYSYDTDLSSQKILKLQSVSCCRVCSDCGAGQD